MLTHYLKDHPTLTDRVANRLSPPSDKGLKEQILKTLVSLGFAARDSSAQDESITHVGKGTDELRIDPLWADLEKLASSDVTAKDMSKAAYD